jgi:ribosomal protein S18
LNRRINSFKKLKEDITKLRAILTDIKSKEKQEDLINVKYDNKKVINTLKSSDSIDFANNVKALSLFTTNIIKRIDSSINNDIGSIKHLISQTTSNIIKNPINIMKPSIPTAGLSSGVLKGYETSDDLIDCFHSVEKLPGDIALIAHLPKNTINSLDETIKAYNSSSMFLGVNINSYKEIENIDYMNAASLEKYLDELDKLCGVCISHQTLYETIIKQKTGLRYNFKLYFNTLINSKNKVSMDNSLIEYVYLKSMFIDKVYLAAAMDVHDYSIKVINNSLSFIKSNIKKL